MAATRVVGVGLVLLGLLLLVVLQTDVGGEAVPLFIGAGFLVVYATTRQYGLLIAGGILTGLGAGLVAEAATDLDDATLLGLGLGFVLAAVVDLGVRGRTGGFWWPLIPGGILTVIGLVTMPATQGWAAYLIPAALIVAGLALIAGRGRPGTGRGRPGTEEAHGSVDAP